MASGAGWGARGVGTGSGHPLSPASSISPPSPPLRPGLPKVEEVVSLALSLPPFVYMLSTTGGGRGHADAGGGGVALQLCKLPFHSHKALPGGGGCPRLQNSSSHQLTDTRGCTQVGPAAPRKPRTPTQLPGLGFWRTLKPLPSFVKLQPRERKRWGGGFRKLCKWKNPFSRPRPTTGTQIQNPLPQILIRRPQPSPAAGKVLSIADFEPLYPHPRSSKPPTTSSSW